MAKKTITYSEDIIKNVAKKYNLAEDKVEYVHRMFFQMMREKMSDPNVTEINWPKFGLFYTSLPLLRIKQKELHLGLGNAPENKKYMKVAIETTEKRIASIEARNEKFKSNMWYGRYYELVHSSFPMLYRKALRKNMTDKELEEFQNKQ
jgi:nucleoid DNA-binding protein